MPTPVLNHSTALPLVGLNDLPDYLRRRGVVPKDSAVTVGRLSGGISNVVMRARWSDGDVVVKQSLPRLQVDAEWHFDRARVYIEHACLETLGTLLPGAAPRPVFLDREAFTLVMEHAPPGGIVLEDAHMAGDVRIDRLAACGSLLGRLQLSSAADPTLRNRFGDLMPLVQGRIDPYHRTVAALHPDLRRAIETEVERLLRTRQILVHGDYAPKNLLAYGDGKIMMLDVEVAHWGDPSFDVAFMLSHLLLGSCHRVELAAQFLGAAHEFWTSYVTSAGEVRASEASVVAELGCLLMARIDGKSPVKYLTDARARSAVRDYARTLILGRGGSRVEQALELAPPMLHGAQPA